MDAPCDAVDIRKCSFTVLLSAGSGGLLNTVKEEKGREKKSKFGDTAWLSLALSTALSFLL